MEYTNIFKKLFLLFFIWVSSIHSSFYDVKFNSIALQADGKIVASGSVFINNNQLQFISSRYNTNGSLDTAYGTGGTVTTQFTSATSSAAFANAIQADGRCVVAGLTVISGISQLAIARYTTAGILDTTFNGNGTVNISVNNGANAQAVLVQPADQFIVAAGSTVSGGQTRVLVTRFDTVGALDNGFNGSGIATIVLGEQAQANGVALGTSNTILIAGYAIVNGQRRILLARFTSAGALDGTFGTGGIVTTAFGTDDYATDVAILGTGQILITGQSNGTAFCARYTSAGVLDVTYGSGGILYLSLLGVTSVGTSLALQTDSKPVISGMVDNQFFTARLLTTGTYDPTFNTTGFRITPLGSEGRGSGILVQADGNIVSGGYFDYSTFLQRLTTTGAFDTTYSQNGVMTQPQGLPSPTFFGNDVVVDKVYGNDLTGKRNWAPFQTITAALAAALPGDACYIMPGAYNEIVTIPANVSVKGISQKCVTIQSTVAVATNLITMGLNSSLEDVTLSLTSSSHVQLQGVVFPNTTTTNSYIKNCAITVDNSTAAVGGVSTIIGIRSSGTGTPGQDFISVDRCDIKVLSTGASGTKAGILVDTASSLRVRDSLVFLTNIAGAATYLGVQTNNASAQCTLTTCTVGAPTADISQTLGNITIVDTYLINSDANGLGFTVEPYPKQLFFGVQGGTAITAGVTQRFLTQGTIPTATFNTNTAVIPFYVTQNMILSNLAFQARASAQSAASTGTFTVQINGVDTALTLAITGTTTSAINNTTSVQCFAGDSLSIKYVVSGSGTRTLTDFCVTLDMY